MPLLPSTVELANDADPVFPDRCLVCAKEGPNDSVRLIALFNAYKPLDEDLLAIRRATVPVCSGCKTTLTRSRWLGKALGGAAVLVSVLVILAMIQIMPADLPDWVGYVALGLALVIPYVVALKLYTPHFDFSPWDRRVIFEFRSRPYAQEFAELSHGELRD